MKHTVFTGSAVALVTPMHPDLSVNYEKLGELIEFHIQNETDAIVVVGTTGEGSTLTDEEHMKVIEYTVKHVAGRMPVIAGTGSNNTAHAVELSKQAEALGADALLQERPIIISAPKRDCSCILRPWLKRFPCRSSFIMFLPEPGLIFYRLPTPSSAISLILSRSRKPAGTFPKSPKFCLCAAISWMFIPVTTTRLPRRWRWGQRVLFLCWPILSLGRLISFARAILTAARRKATISSSVT